MGILDGKSVMITGAASGIGEATAKEAAAEGAKLMLCDVNAEKGGRLRRRSGARDLPRLRRHRRGGRWRPR